MEYLVKWKTFDDIVETTWEPASNLLSVKDMIDKFESKQDAKKNDMTWLYSPRQ